MKCWHLCIVCKYSWGLFTKFKPLFFFFPPERNHLDRSQWTARFVDGEKKTYSSLLAGEPSNDDWYTLSFVWQVLFYWGQPNKTFTLLSSVFQSTSPLFECEMATQVLLNHKGGVCPCFCLQKQVWRQKCLFHLLVLSATLNPPLPSHIPRKPLSSSRGRWCLAWKVLGAEPATGKRENRDGNCPGEGGTALPCAAATDSAQQSNGTSRVCWQQATFPMGDKEDKAFLLVNAAYFYNLNFL